MLPGLIGYAHTVGVVAVAGELHMIYECPVLQPLMQQYAALFPQPLTLQGLFFAQHDPMQVFQLCFGLS